MWSEPIRKNPWESQTECTLTVLDPQFLWIIDIVESEYHEDGYYVAVNTGTLPYDRAGYMTQDDIPAGSLYLTMKLKTAAFLIFVLYPALEETDKWVKSHHIVKSIWERQNESPTRSGQILPSCIRNSHLFRTIFGRPRSA